jgi:hypothetical protein
VEEELLTEVVERMNELRTAINGEEVRLRQHKVLLERAERVYSDLAVRDGDWGATVDAETLLSEVCAVKPSSLSEIVFAVERSS